jgi:hypothetical protein
MQKKLSVRAACVRWRSQSRKCVRGTHSAVDSSFLNICMTNKQTICKAHGITRFAVKAPRRKLQGIERESVFFSELCTGEITRAKRRLGLAQHSTRGGHTGCNNWCPRRESASHGRASASGGGRRGLRPHSRPHPRQSRPPLLRLHPQQVKGRALSKGLYIYIC